MNSQVLKKNLILIDRVTSTNDIIARYEDNTTLLAKEQTKGRGTRHKSWLSERNNLFMSHKLCSSKVSCNKGLLSIMIGIACIEALINEQNKLYLKWPNDLLNADFQKIGGILIEEYNKKYLIGIGINTCTNGDYAHYKLNANQSILTLSMNIIDKLECLLEAKSEQIVDKWYHLTAMPQGTEIICELRNKCKIKAKVSHLGLNGELFVLHNGSVLPIHSASIFINFT